jgi:phosphoribosylaminoimidazolecarboxamide formyltransferase/IMP cyclohydrolase
VSDERPLRRALISVYDKTGLEELVTALHAAEVELVSTGSTAARISAAGVPVTAVEQVTGFPECLDGRVKTLHPGVHAGLLADRRLPEPCRQLEELRIEPFDLLVSNLYPFTATVMSGASREECVEQIDIGGPAMVRAAAKNHPSVAVVTSPGQYPQVLQALQGDGFSLEERQSLAAAAFRHTATYDVAVASWLGNVVAPDPGPSPFPAWVGATWEQKAVLRYGENPHQAAAVYTGFGRGPGRRRTAARQGDVVQQLRRRRRRGARSARLSTLGGRDHQARQPVRHRGRGRRRERARQGARLRPGVGVRRRDRGEPAGDPAMAEQWPTSSPRWWSPRHTTTTRWTVLRRKKNVRLLLLPRPPRTAAETRPISGGMLMQQRDHIDAPGDDPASWTLAAGDRGGRGHPRRPRLRLAGSAGGEVQRHPASARTAPASGSGWDR